MKQLISIASILSLGLFSNTANAQRWVFPYNHTDLDWYTIETDHFAFHYPVSKKKENNEHYLTAEYSARRFATVAEENYDDMCAEFDYYLKERVHVLVLNQGDELEGFTIPTFDWIVMSANPGGGYFSYSRGRMEWFSTVFAHEFAHVVSLKAIAAHSEPTFYSTIGGLYSNGINFGSSGRNDKISLNSMDLGFEVPFGDSDSVFWTEGGAEFWSASTNVNWWTSARDRTIRTSYLEDRLLTYEEWHHKIVNGWNDGERWYQGGHSFALYLRERFGARAFAEFALVYGAEWRPNFETVFLDVVGVDAETLYYDWLAYISEQYERQYDKVRAKGEVVGKELIDYNPEWEYKSPSARDAFIGDTEGVEERGWFGRKTKREREQQLEGTGTWNMEPRVSPDGKYIGHLSRGAIKVKRYDREEVRAFTGVTPVRLSTQIVNRNLKSFTLPFATFDHGWDFVPNGDQPVEALVTTGQEDVIPRGKFTSVTKIRMERDGYNWNELVYYKFPEYHDNKFGFVDYKSRMAKNGFAEKRMWQGEWYTIPNTKRGHDPSVSPDGKRVAFLEYTDGTVNLATINIDGSDKKYITEYSDGTWMRTIDWSPDGKKLVFTLFRNFQQNIFVVNADGTDLQAIMMDEWEEQDPHWGVDGKIYFSADPDGIANIFSYDPETKEFLQITNVINGSYSPQITNDGDLVYLYYTAHGWKIYGLPKNQFMNEPATQFFNTEYSQEHQAGYLEQTLDDSYYEKMTTKYRARKAMSAPIMMPIYRVENDTRTNWGVQGGLAFNFWDYAQYNQFAGEFTLGEDSFGRLTYINDMTPISLIATAGWFIGKNESGFLLDGDQNPDTVGDQNLYEVKRMFQQRFGGLYGSYTWNSRLSSFFGVSGYDLGFKGIDSTQGFDRFMYSLSPFVNFEWSNNAFLRRSANPSFGRTVTFALTRGMTDIVYVQDGGVTIDDGEILDNYQFNQVDFQWTEIIPVPTFWTDFMAEAQKRRHVLQLDADIGFIDRNVTTNDEYRGGGRHPYFLGYQTIQTNSQFAGYPNFALNGETKLILNAAYRFPITFGGRFPDKKILAGPLYLSGVYAQISGTAGNLWSYSPPSDPSQYYRSRYGERVAFDPTDVRREIPFVDKAYKNDNYMLYDVSAEIRVTSLLYHSWDWNSFVRLAYGFNSVRGIGDVNGDSIFDTNDNNLGDELSNEREPAGFRLYVGLGTGW